MFLLTRVESILMRSGIDHFIRGLNNAGYVVDYTGFFESKTVTIRWRDDLQVLDDNRLAKRFEYMYAVLNAHGIRCWLAVDMNDEPFAFAGQLPRKPRPGAWRITRHPE